MALEKSPRGILPWRLSQRLVPNLTADDNRGSKIVAGTAANMTFLGGCNIPANGLRSYSKNADRAVRINVRGRYRQNTGSNKTLGIVVFVGSTVVWWDDSLNVPASATERAFSFEAELQANGSLTDAEGGGLITIGPADAGTNGVGGVGADSLLCAPISFSSTVDMSADRAFMFLVYLSVAGDTTNHWIQRMYSNAVML